MGLLYYNPPHSLPGFTICIKSNYKVHVLGRKSIISRNTQNVMKGALTPAYRELINMVSPCVLHSFFCLYTYLFFNRFRIMSHTLSSNPYIHLTAYLLSLFAAHPITTNLIHGTNVRLTAFQHQWLKVNTTTNGVTSLESV